MRRRLVPTLLLVLPALVALVVLGRIAHQLYVRESPTRAVAFDDAWGSSPRCGGPVYWTGTEAIAACDSSGRRGLVRFDPVRAVATVIHRWYRDDGDGADLHLAESCGNGQLFVVAERRHATAIIVDERNVATRAVDLSRDLAHRVLAGSCEGDVPELLVERESELAVLRLEGEAFEVARTVSVAELHVLDHAFRRARGAIPREVAVVNADGTFVTKRETDMRVRFDGLPGGRLDLLDAPDVFYVQRATALPIASGRYSALAIDARALPLDDGGVAIWGGLGDEVVVLDANLERTDTIGPLARIVRPIHGAASGTSALDEIAYFTALLLTLIWLGFAIAALRRPRLTRLRDRIAIAYCIAAPLCAVGFFRIVDWL